MITIKTNIYEVHEAMPEATIIVIHMEGVDDNDNILSRIEINQFLRTKISHKVLIPDDGERYEF